jgi:acyl carrier protein phosphodiesterase
MNYLAHIFLARHSDDAMVGALLGDFVKPNSGLSFSSAMEAEIVTHRKVDAFTDSHRVVLGAKQMFSGARRRYAGILLDVFYDHALATDWPRYCDVPLAAFIARFHEALARHASILPPRLKMAAPYMIEQGWLASYEQYEGLETAICRMSARLSRNADLLRDGLLDLRSNYDAFIAGFREFFPELIAFVEKRRNEQRYEGR